MKVTESPVPVDTKLRRLAVTAIGCGRTPDALRRESAGTHVEAECKELADEVEVLTARGVTARVAKRILRERARREPPAPASPEETARAVRGVAAAMLAEGWTSAQVRTAGSEKNGTARTFREFADAMDELTAVSA